MASSCPVFPTHSRITLIILAFLLCSVVTHVSAQQAKPNLTGTWILNRSKSKLSPHPAPGDVRYKIKHSEPRIEMELLFLGRSNTYSYMTDGKERVARQSLQDGAMRAKAYWDSNTLVIEKHQAIPFQTVGAFVTISRYTLSQDGKSLAITSHTDKSSSSAAVDESLTFEKQE
jgi:hypothetical protein